MEFFLQQFVDGLANGTAYALVALGFTLIFGVMGVLNVAQATMVMVGPMIGLTLLSRGVDSFWLILVVGMIGAGLASLLVERVALRPFVNLLRVSRSSDADHLAPFIATLGIVIAAQHLAALIYGSRARSFSPGELKGQMEVFGVFIGRTQVLALVIAAILLALLELLLRKTRFGLWMRATADNPRAASFSGVNIRFVLAASTAVAGMLGAAGGILVASMDTVASPYMDLEYGLKALVIMIIGGLGSLYGAVIAAIALGLLEAFAVGYLASHLRDLIAFAMLLAVLLVRPMGLVPAKSTA